MVECEDDGTPPTNNNPSKTSHKDMYSAVIRRLLTELRLMGPKGKTVSTELAKSIPFQLAHRHRMSQMYSLKRRVLGVLPCSLPFILSPSGLEFRELLTRQEKFVDDLVKLVKAVASEKADRPKKIERLQVSLDCVFLCFM